MVQKKEHNPIRIEPQDLMDRVAFRIIAGLLSSLIHRCRIITVPAQLGPRELAGHFADRELDWLTSTFSKRTKENLIEGIFSNDIA